MASDAECNGKSDKLGLFPTLAGLCETQLFSLFKCLTATQCHHVPRTASQLSCQERAISYRLFITMLLNPRSFRGIFMFLSQTACTFPWEAML